MVYKIGKVSDLSTIPLLDEAKEYLYYYANILSTEYGEDRNPNNDIGGYILYALPDATDKEIKAYFDYSKNVPECFCSNGVFCSVVYITGDDFGVVIVAPIEFIKNINNKGDTK